MATDAGMQVLWTPDPFTSVVDYDSWEEALIEDADILRHVVAGQLVPINLGDAAFEFVVRVGDADQSAELTERERTQLLVTSDPYLIISGEKLYLTGLEHVSATPDDQALRVTAPAGRYAVTVNLIDWESEPGSQTPSGDPALHALPDFVLLLNPAASPEATYRRSLQTLPPPPETTA
ncbi:hypothetical protein [Micromonospora sp. URMC 103]|uniref:hypothetical protein n=1 Tax=Micromonospora sp. URMC 103 TaxID=3423406 RepID=UPI003F1CC312